MLLSLPQAKRVQRYKKESENLRILFNIFFTWFLAFRFIDNEENSGIEEKNKLLLKAILRGAVQSLCVAKELEFTFWVYAWIA